MANTDYHPVAKDEQWLCGVCGNLMEILPCKPMAEVLQHKCHQCNVVVQANRTVGMLKKLPAKVETPVGAA